MEMICAECGCRVDVGIRIVPCPEPLCCCQELPVWPVPDQLAELPEEADPHT